MCRVLSFFLLVTFGSVAVGQEEPPDYKAYSDLEEFQQILINRSNLKDPFSAHVRNLYSRETASGFQHYCGEINAKNSYGAYNGWKHFFFALPPDGPATVDTYTKELTLNTSTDEIVSMAACKAAYD